MARALVRFDDVIKRDKINATMAAARPRVSVIYRPESPASESNDDGIMSKFL